jgi:hypothetical protein
VITAFAAWFVLPVLRRRPSARFFALGALLSLLPLAATIPADRLLVLVGFGVMPLLALAMHDALQSARGFKSPAAALDRTARRKAAVLLACVHLVLEPMLLPISALSTAFVAHWTELADDSLPADARLPEQVVIVAAVPDSVLLSFLPSMRDWTGKPRPKKLYWLDATPGEAIFERRGESTLRVSAQRGLFDRRSEARGKHVAFRPGDKVVLSELTIEVVELNREGLPSVCDFVFALPLESPKYRWETWQDGGLRSFHVPQLGQHKRVSTS